MSKHTLTYSDLIDFSNALDVHILNSECFFDDGLLNLIDKHLGYNCCTFVCYEANRIYKDSHGHNMPMGEHYEQSFLPQDPLAKYISTNFDELYSRDVNIIKSSDVFPDYPSSEFHQFLNTYMDLSYVAVIPFNNLRLSVYKSTSEGDFTDKEVMLLYTLETILMSKYTLFSKIVKPSYGQTLEELKNKYFDTLSTGVIILSSKYEELDCNSIGRQYMNLLSPALSLESYFANLIPLLNLSPAYESSSYTERILKLDDFIINIKLYPTSADESNVNNHVYFITIVSNSSDGTGNGDNSNNDINNTQQLNVAFAEKYHLSPREAEVVEALSYGKKYQDIADSLFISINTVRTHVKNIYRKLEIDNQRNLLYLYNQFIQSEKQ